MKITVDLCWVNIGHGGGRVYCSANDWHYLITLSAKEEHQFVF